VLPTKDLKMQTVYNMTFTDKEWWIAARAEQLLSLATNIYDVRLIKIGLLYQCINGDGDPVATSIVAHVCEEKMRELLSRN